VGVGLTRQVENVSVPKTLHETLHPCLTVDGDGGGTLREGFSGGSGLDFVLFRWERLEEMGEVTNQRGLSLSDKTNSK
jgi:hypothetical protein